MFSPPEPNVGGVVWSNPEEWERRKSQDGCVICLSGAPLDVIAETANCPLAPATKIAYTPLR